jgi:hypothetical protein
MGKLRKNLIERDAIMDRVSKWLDRIEYEAEPWNNDGGELLGTLKLNAVHSGYCDEDADLLHVSILCEETLSEEHVG